MAISSAGVGSGLNVQSIVSQLVAVEQQPVKLLQAKGSTLQTKLSIFGQIKSELSALQDAAKALVDPTLWDSKSLVSSNTASVTGTATSAAASGSFGVTVDNLLSTQSGTVQVAAAYQAPENYQISIKLGTRVKSSGNPDVFTPGAADAVTVDVTQGQSLTDIAAGINAKSTTSGVVATVVNTSSGQKLALRGVTGGANSGFQITSADTLGNSFTDGLIQQPVANGPFDGGTWTTAQYAQDAKVRIDGIEVTSSTNSVSGAVTGVTLNLQNASTTPASISIDTDKSTIKTKIQAFQDAYNKLYADLKTQTAYNAASKTGGPLMGDNTANSIMSMMRNLSGTSVPTGTGLTRLSDLGMQVQSDGSLTTNSTKLDAALQKLSNVKALFSNVGARPTKMASPSVSMISPTGRWRPAARLPHTMPLSKKPLTRIMSPLPNSMTTLRSTRNSCFLNTTRWMPAWLSSVD